MTLTLFSRSLHYKYSKVSVFNAVKSLCAHYPFTQWLKFDQTSTDTSSGLGKEVIRFWWHCLYFQGHCIINTQKVSLVCTLCFFLHILISIVRNLNTFCINVHIHEMLLLQKKKGQGINTVIVIPLCHFLMSVTLVFSCVSCLIILGILFY